MRRTAYIIPCVCCLIMAIQALPEATGDVAAADVLVNADAVVSYVQSCRKPNGAFGPIDQEYTDAAWNYPAVRSLQLLNAEIPEPDAVIAHGSGSPPGHAGYGHGQFFHHHGLRQALDRSIEPDHRSVDVEHQGFKIDYYSHPLGTTSELFFKSGGRPNPDPLDIGCRLFYYAHLTSLHDLLAGLSASHRAPSDRQPLIDYVTNRRAAGGGYCDLRTSEGNPRDDDAHIVATLHAVASLDLLQAAVLQPEKVADFIHSCRQDDGSYRWNPQEDLPGNDGDVYYTWAALRTLKLLNQSPQQVQATRAWINTLQNADGGFGDRPAWRSRLYSSFYAVEALSLCGGHLRDSITTKRLAPLSKERITGDDLHVFQAQFKMPVVQPSELGQLRRQGFNLLALKSDRFSDLEPLLAAIRKERLEMDVILCPEAYPHRLVQLGDASLHHVGNFTLDPRWSPQQRKAWQEADIAGRGNLSWAGYRDQVTGPMQRLGSFVYPEQDFEQSYAYIAYDSDPTGGSGYNAVLTGFNWAPSDFVRVFPWRERYVDRLTPIADVDAHGDLSKWSSQLSKTRNLFIARGPTFPDFQEAAAQGRVVCVVAGAEGVPSGFTYYGPRPAVDFVRERIDTWRFDR